MRGLVDWPPALRRRQWENKISHMYRLRNSRGGPYSPFLTHTHMAHHAVNCDSRNNDETKPIGRIFREVKKQQQQQHKHQE